MLKPIRACSALIVLTVLALPATPLFAAADGAAPEPDRRNFASVMRGAKLFQQNCAACHGKRAEGTPNWRTPAANGKFPPPPLDGSAHAWHHPTRDLLQTIRFGTIAMGGGMPAWGGTLDEQQMMDILSWLQSKWPEEKYQEWQRRDERVSRR